MKREDDDLQAVAAATSHDPFRVLGLRRCGDAFLLRVFRPDAVTVALECGDALLPLQRVGDGGFFEWSGAQAPPIPYRLHIATRDGVHRLHDPYGFPPEAPEFDLHLFAEGTHCQAWRLLGALPQTRNGVAGVCFRTWAPNAQRVSVVGDFNGWDGRIHPMASLGASGVWTLFLPDLPAGSLYKFELRSRAGGQVLLKADPYARASQLRPDTTSVVSAAQHVWQDRAWMDARAAHPWLHAPMSIYELHAGSWMRHPDGRFHSFREMAERLVPYVKDLGFTHVELMPVMEHPLDESWGYQCTGFFAPSARFGTPDDLRHLIDTCHQAGIGVILDWVPGHFPRDAWALAQYDGSELYEHEDPRRRHQPDWGTYVFNYGRNEVRSFLLSSAHLWLSEFHADGLRVDAVASMIYLDYSRAAGEWLPNRHGGRENLEAIDFLRQLNEMVHREFPGALTIAEESTAWPMVSRPTHVGGLGFSMKWNMGWMNDMLHYMATDPVHRRYCHDRLTFGPLYAWSENFVLPLSHDEVVHGKASLLGKMPGDAWQRFAGVRLLLTCQMAWPGKKLLFMGGEFAQGHEWRDGEELAWHLLQSPLHAGVQRLVRDLNHLHVSSPELHQQDFDAAGFSWIDCHDVENSVVSWLRYALDGRFVVVVLNFTPVPRIGYRIGVPLAGAYRVLLDSDATHYGGSGISGDGVRNAVAEPFMNRAATLTLDLPPLAGLVLKPCRRVLDS